MRNRGALDFLSFAPTLIFDTMILGMTLLGVRQMLNHHHMSAARRPCARALNEMDASPGHISMKMLNQTLQYYWYDHCNAPRISFYAILTREPFHSSV